MPQNCPIVHIQILSLKQTRAPTAISFVPLLFILNSSKQRIQKLLRRTKLAQDQTAAVTPTARKRPPVKILYMVFRIASPNTDMNGIFNGIYPPIYFCSDVF